eukprot:6458667-Amphidinium_carterae.4
MCGALPFGASASPQLRCCTLSYSVWPYVPWRHTIWVYCAWRTLTISHKRNLRAQVRVRSLLGGLCVELRWGISRKPNKPFIDVLSTTM